jgi:hypothetical protein
LQLEVGEVQLLSWWMDPKHILLRDKLSFTIGVLITWWV